MINLSYADSTKVKDPSNGDRELFVSDNCLAPVTISTPRKIRITHPSYRPRYVEKRRPINNTQRKRRMRNTIRSFRRNRDDHR